MYQFVRESLELDNALYQVRVPPNHLTPVTLIMRPLYIIRSVMQPRCTHPSYIAFYSVSLCLELIEILVFDGLRDNVHVTVKVEQLYQLAEEFRVVTILLMHVGHVDRLAGVKLFELADNLLVHDNL